MLEVCEIFGPTWQGEGKFLGREVVFLRLRRCNLACSWCDTKFSWSKDDPGYYKFEKLSLVDVVTRLLSTASWGTEGIVISGGEPLLWKKQICELISLLPRPWRVEIETNGTIPPGPLKNIDKVHFNVSPKLVSSNQPNDLHRIKQRALEEYVELANQERAIFKFVAAAETWIQDEKEVLNLERTLHIHPVYIMPEGATLERQLESLQGIANSVLGHGWRLTPRLHTLIWGNKRGH